MKREKRGKDNIVNEKSVPLSPQKECRNMKRIIFLVVSLVFTVSINAEGIDRNTALKKAQRFMPGKEFSTGKTLPSARAKAPCKNDAFYIFNAKDDGGYVIVSGDDRTTEILGYALQGHLDADLLPENLKWWLDSYARQIEALGTSLTPAKHSGVIQGDPIAPLITAQWSQRAPYNYMCPDGDYVDFNEEGYDADNRCATGCVATAMAQVMYYWKWPESCPTIDGYMCFGHSMNALPGTTFKWDLIKDSYSAQETGESADAVAELMRYCGQAVKMAFSRNGSSASYNHFRMSLTFQYSPNCNKILRDKYSTKQWENIIYDELAAHRPVIYLGKSNSSAHAFVVDGYDDNGLFHINWGWGGSYNSYFILSFADPYGESEESTSDGAFQFDQYAHIGLKPAEADETILPIISSVVQSSSNNTYSRQKVSDNFTNVNLNGSIIGSYIINPPYTRNAEIGWALYQDDALIQRIETKKITIGNNLQMYDNDSKVSFGANLTEGKYQLCQIYRFEGEEEWERCLDGVSESPNILLAEVTPTTMSVRVPESDYVINSISFSEEPEVGSTLNINANIINTGDFYNDIFLLEIQKPGDSQWVTIDKAASHLEPGESGDFLFSFIPDEAGTIPARIKTNSSIGSDKTLKTFTIKIAATEKITLNNVTYLCAPEYGHAKVVENADADNTAKTVTISSSIISGGIECKVVSIEKYAFFNWRNLSEITIPAGIAYIDSRAFLGNNLSSVVSHIQDPPVIDENTFKRSKWNYNTNQYDYYPSLATLYVPIGTKAKYETLSGWTQFAKIEEGEPAETKIGDLRYSYVTGGSTATVIQDESYKELTAVTIPSTITIGDRSYQVTTIDNEAFYDCQKLETISLPEGLQHIGDKAFYLNKSITKVTFPSTLNVIGNYSFFACSKIETLAVPEGVEHIGDWAFAYMNALKKLELPSSLIEIGQNVITGNSSLTFVISNITEPFTVSDNTFASSSATLYVPIGTKAKYEALSGWTQFAKIEEGEPAETKIGDLRYSYVTGGSTATVIQDESYKELTAVTIPSTITIGDRSYQVTTIDNEAFYDCQKLETISLPEGLQHIGDKAFYLNKSITKVTFPSTLNVIGNYSFFACSKIETLAVPEGVEHIGDWAFAYMNALKKLELPSSLIEIGQNVITGNSSLTFVISNITEPFTVSDNTFASSSATLYVPIGTKAKYEALSGWTQFAKIEEGEPAETKIGDLRYSYVTGGSTATVIQDESYKELTAVTIPSTITIGERSYQVTAIDNYAFLYCPKLVALTLSEGLQSIGKNAFASNGFSELTFPSTLRSIGDNAFINCTQIKTLVIPEGVEAIGKSAFAYMWDLKYLELPSTLKEIGEGVVEGSSDLTSVVSHITEPFAVSDNTFASSSATLYVPIGTKAKYEALSGWTQFAEIVEGEPEPDGIISIKNEKINKKSETSAGAWYNLQGIQVSKPQKGVYLRNHKKYISK